MAYALLDDLMPENPKLVRVGPVAGWLYVCGICYCARLLTDGFIPSAVVPRLTNVRNREKWVARLVEERLWEPVEGGYQVHDYLIYNRSRDQIFASKAAAAERQKRRRLSVESPMSRRDSRVTRGRASKAESESESNTDRATARSESGATAPDAADFRALLRADGCTEEEIVLAERVVASRPNRPVFRNRTPHSIARYLRQVIAGIRSGEVPTALSSDGGRPEPLPPTALSSDGGRPEASAFQQDFEQELAWAKANLHRFQGGHNGER